jgi:hypothetical protein
MVPTARVLKEAFGFVITSTNNARTQYAANSTPSKGVSLMRSP